MKEKPIPFSTPMVQALLNTKPNTWPPEPIDASKPCKGMTRRVMLPQPPLGAGFRGWCIEGNKKDIGSVGCVKPESDCFIVGRAKPRYEVGDVLWVRETHTPIGHDKENYILIDYKADLEKLWHQYEFERVEV